MMKINKLLTVIFLLFVFSACAGRVPKKVEGVKRTVVEPSYLEKMNGMTEGHVVFLTAYGEIKKGASMAEVMNILGFPHNISSNGQNEAWYYNYDAGKALSVNFSRNEVVEVKEITGIVTD